MHYIVFISACQLHCDAIYFQNQKIKFKQKTKKQIEKYIKLFFVSIAIALENLGITN